ncbi:MAG: PEP-CTERM sorting domain-containing protein [Gemmatirosa sp.]|nr:PEP-CTERM sorting domain-containing protein [Gemmatirosa sp.]
MRSMLPLFRSTRPTRSTPLAIALLASLATAPLGAQAFQFSNGNVDGRMAMASRPDAPGIGEIEAADDFVLGATTRITSASFTGLLPFGHPLTDVNALTVEIYRVFPLDSHVPESGNVPTRTNSPSDVAFASRSVGSGLTFTTTLLDPSFTAANSVLNGIHGGPTPKTGGEGPVSGQEVRFDVTFTTPFVLPGDHYFFVPQVGVTGGDFFWLSSVRPIVPPGTPFAPDLQAWMRNEALDPDWLRVGTDIVGLPVAGGAAPTFNGQFALQGQVVPEPATITLVAGGLALTAAMARRRRRA